LFSINLIKKIGFEREKVVQFLDPWGGARSMRDFTADLNISPGTTLDSIVMVSLMHTGVAKSLYFLTRLLIEFSNLIVSVGDDFPLPLPFMGEMMRKFSYYEVRSSKDCLVDFSGALKVVVALSDDLPLPLPVSNNYLKMAQRLKTPVAAKRLSARGIVSLDDFARLLLRLNSMNGFIGDDSPLPLPSVSCSNDSRITVVKVPVKLLLTGVVVGEDCVVSLFFERSRVASVVDDTPLPLPVMEPFSCKIRVGKTLVRACDARTC
jgi:hypothetical protein